MDNVIFLLPYSMSSKSFQGTSKYNFMVNNILNLVEFTFQYIINYMDDDGES